MCIIIAYHLVSNGILKVNGNGTFSLWNSGSEINRIFSCFLFPGGAVGNMIFFMISGYFLSTKEFCSCRKVVYETVFYSVPLAMLFVILKLFDISLYNYGGGDRIFNFLLLPLASSQNWFSTAYVLILLMLPNINKFFNSFNKLGFIAFLFFIDIFWVGFGYILSVPFYDLLLAVFYYSCGVFYKRFLNNKEKHQLLLCIVCIILWSIAAIIAFFYFDFSEEHKKISRFFYVLLRNFFAPLLAFLIFRFFLSIEMEYKRLLNKVASTTFAVYLIHGSIFQRFLWDSVLKINTFQYQSEYFPFFVFFDVIGIFAMCSITDIFYRKIIKMWLKSISNKIRVIKNL